MKSFKQFIKEMPERLNDIGDSEEYMKSSHKAPRAPGPYDYDEEHGEIEDGHTMNSRTFKSKNDEEPDSESLPHTYWASHPDHEGIKASGSTTGKNRDTFKVNHVSKDPESSVSGSDFYAHILDTGLHKFIESDNKQTAGGESIWHRLSHDYNDVHVTRHDKDGNEIPLHRGENWNKNFTDEHGEQSTFRATLK